MLKILKKIIHLGTCPKCNQLKELKLVQNEEPNFEALVSFNIDCHIYRMKKGCLKLCEDCYSQFSEQSTIYREAVKQKGIRDLEELKKQKYIEELKKAVELKELENRAIALGIDTKSFLMKKNG